MDAEVWWLNDYIVKQNHKMVTGGRNRDEIPWEKAEAEDVEQQEKALKWHVEIAEPDWGDGGKAKLPGVTPRAALRRNGQ